MTRNVVLGLVAVSLAVLSVAAYAGKPERDKVDAVKPGLEQKAKEIKEACGCQVAINVQWDTYTKAEDMNRIIDCATSFAKAAQHQCNNAANKKALCDNVSSLEISYSKSVPKPETKGKAIQAGSNNM